jgi:malonate transporter and related proteins
MKQVVDSALPLFALILTGYLAGRSGILGAAATDSLNRFVVWLALPALLFQAVAETRFAQINQPGFVLAIGLGMVGTFLLSLALDRRRKGRLADASIEALAASYPNTGFMGIPLCLAVFGHEGLPPAIIATILTACLLFGISLALIELGLQRGPGAGRALLKVGAALARNPLLVAPALGLLFAAARVPLPGPVLRFTGLLGSAASPCALVTVGLFLAQSRASGEARAIGRIVVLKMLVQPLVTGVLAFAVFRMPRLWASAALLLNALPIGTGPFMLAKLYDREAAVTSRAILISTLLSLVTISLLVAWLGRP